MKKLRVRNSTIRQRGLEYCLDDLYRMTVNAGKGPWEWAKQENITRSISRKGFFFKKHWADISVLLQYASYLTPMLYRDVKRALGTYRNEDLAHAVGRTVARKLDPWYAASERGTMNHLIKIMDEEDDRSLMRYRHTPTRSVSHHRSGSSSVTHHRSEPDYLSGVAVHSILSSPSYSSHSSSSSCSWSGDSGSSDSGGGGCD